MSPGKAWDNLKKEYSCALCLLEFKSTLDRMVNYAPLFTKYVIVVKTLFYMLSWATTHVNDACVLVPEKVFFELQVWRLFTAPLVTTSFFSSFWILIPFYALAVLCPAEWELGSLYTCIYFNLMSCLVCLIKSAIYLPLAISLGN
jgi:hypothetical protein